MIAFPCIISIHRCGQSTQPKCAFFQAWGRSLTSVTGSNRSVSRSPHNSEPLTGRSQWLSPCPGHVPPPLFMPKPPSPPLVRTPGGMCSPPGSLILSASQNLHAHLERPFPNTVTGTVPGLGWRPWVAAQTAQSVSNGKAAPML